MYTNIYCTTECPAWWTDWYKYLSRMPTSECALMLRYTCVLFLINVA